MFLEIRYLLHGQIEKYHSEETLYIISESDSLWAKLTQQVLSITNESWRLIHPALSGLISEEKFDKFGISRLTSDAVIKLLNKLRTESSNFVKIFGKIQLNDDERKEILNEIGKNPENKNLWKSLPLHKTLKGNLVCITENTYLKNFHEQFLKNSDEQLLLSPKLLEKVTLIRHNSNILHLQEEGWILQWNASAAMKVLLESFNTHDYTELILNIWQSYPDIKREYRDKLKEAAWLKLSSGQAIAPKQILKYPDYLRHYEQDLIQLNEGYHLPSNLVRLGLNYQSISSLFSECLEEDILRDVLERQPCLYKVILIIIAKKPSILSGEIISLLKSTQWLITTDNTLVKPSQVLYIPESELESEIQNILYEVSNTDLITVSQLHYEIRDNQNALKWLNNQLFIKGNEVLIVVSNIVSQFTQYYLGDFPKDEFPLDNALGVFRGISKNILPIWKLVERVVRILGKENFKQYILPHILQPIEESRLLNLLGWLSESFKFNDTTAIQIYNQYLVLAVNSKNFGTAIIPNILLLNRLGQWKSPKELCVNIPNIAESHILDATQEEIITSYLDRISQAEQQQIIQQQDKRQEQENTVNLEQYFQDWHYHVYSEAIGAFICLIAKDNQKLKELAQTLLRNRDFDLVYDRLLGIVSPRSFSVFESAGNTEQVPSLISGYSFTANKKQGRSESIFVNKLDRHTTKLILSSLNPSEYNREELSNLLKESARNLIQNVYQVTDESEPLDRVWAGLTESEQLDVPVIRNVILDSAPFIIKFLGVHNKNEQINTILLELNKAVSKREEYRTYNRDFSSIDQNIYNLKQQLGSILEKNSSENTASDVLLQAVRDKIKQYGYQLTNIPFEIFQNADDALVELEMMAQGQPVSTERKKFIIEIDKNTITMMYWGRPINCFVHPDYPLHDYRSKGFAQDLEKMLSFNYSDKQNNSNNLETSEVTGKFGLGFKSVHLICREPSVFSNRIAFKIVGGLVPSPLGANRESKSLTTLRDKLERKLQQYNRNIFDGTAIYLPVETSDKSSSGISVDDTIKSGICVDNTIKEFEKLVGLLLIFAKRIKKCYFVKQDETVISWQPQHLSEEQSIEIGEVSIGEFKTNALCLKLSNYGNFVITLDEKEGKLRASLPNAIPNIWVTAPTQERLGLSFIINASFYLNTGRAKIIPNEENDKLAKELGVQLGNELCKLFTIAQNNWEEFKEILQLRRTTHYEFWKLIWDELAVKTLNQQSTLIREILSGNKGMGYFLTTCPALPNGLWGDYQQLILAQDIRYIVDNFLKKEDIFNHVFQWQSVRDNCEKHTIIHGNEWDKFQQLISYSPIKQQFNTTKLNLLKVLQWQLNNSQADIQIAQQIGQLLNENSLEDIKQNSLSEYQELIHWLSRVSFLSKAKTYHHSNNLLVVDSKDIEERHLSAFAPDDCVLNKDYPSKGLEFFYACRQEKLSIGEEKLIQWINMIELEHQKLAVKDYLTYLKLKDGSLSSELEDKLKKIDWVKKIINDLNLGEVIDTQQPETEGVKDTTKQDGTGDPKWGEPGEKLAELFYNQIYNNEINYKLEKKGGKEYDHDYLLRINGEYFKIEVKTISSKSVRFTPSEWNQLATENKFYELFIVEHSKGHVSRVIRIQNVWNTLNQALKKLKLQPLTNENKDIESLIGLQKDSSTNENMIILNWKRLIDNYKIKNGNDNIMIYSCNAELIKGQKDVKFNSSKDFRLQQ
ncbi:hypothetical protein [Nostoc sp. 2RC]|uniref:hypothetical protein n=1 Tax=Nostoc sp. 2RC TaxID=2485484 RepID=UPI0016252D31|nr:hypothetical protein [Nostoc sp. 2RC]MBC1236660.1 hypothetical protein [Nostoc sp. 2RC]